MSEARGSHSSEEEENWGWSESSPQLAPQQPPQQLSDGAVLAAEEAADSLSAEREYDKGSDIAGVQGEEGEGFEEQGAEEDESKANPLYQQPASLSKGSAAASKQRATTLVDRFDFWNSRHRGQVKLNPMYKSDYARDRLKAIEAARRSRLVSVEMTPMPGTPTPKAATEAAEGTSAPAKSKAAGTGIGALSVQVPSSADAQRPGDSFIMTSPFLTRARGATDASGLSESKEYLASFKSSRSLTSWKEGLSTRKVKRKKLKRVLFFILLQGKPFTTWGKFLKSILTFTTLIALMLIVFESRQDAEVRNPEVYLAIEVFLTIIFFTEISVATWACTLDLRLHPKIKQSKEEFVAENPAAGMEGGGGKKPSPRAGDADGSERTLQRRKSHSITTQIIEKRNWRARLLFLLRPLILLENAAFAPIFITMLSGGALYCTDVSTFAKIGRIVRLLRIFKLARYLPFLRVLFNVVWDKWLELGTGITLSIICVVGLSSFVYLFEWKANHQFTSMLDAAYYGVITLATVGYGDIYPVTNLGRLFGGVGALLGIALFSLVPGIVANGFTDRINIRKERVEQALDFIDKRYRLDSQRAAFYYWRYVTEHTAKQSKTKRPKRSRGSIFLGTGTEISQAIDLGSQSSNASRSILQRRVLKALDLLTACKGDPELVLRIVAREVSMLGGRN